jgi:hemolysin D
MHYVSSSLEYSDEERRMTQANPPTPAAGSASDSAKIIPLAKVPVVTEFQPDAVEIEERSPPRIARLTLYMVAALIGAATTWASVASVDQIVAAQGKLIASSSNLVVQPLETSVIREIFGKVGDVVQRGQILARLDPTFSQADVDQLRTRVIALDAAVNRLDAEMNGRDFTAADPGNPDEVTQEKLFVQRKAFYDSSLRNFDAQIASAQANLQTTKDDEGVMSQRLETLRSIETMRSSLMEKEVGSRLNFLLSQDARLEVEGSLSRARGNKVDNTHRIEKAHAERQAFIEDFRRTALQELVDNRAKRSVAEEELKKAELRRHMIVLTAPVDSVILEVAHRSVGSVLREAETLFVLVPRDVPLEAEVNVDSKDIGEIKVGQPVRLKFEAFPFQKYGTGLGVVRVISPDSFSADTKNEGGRQPPPFFRLLVDLTETHLRGLPEHFQMVPGMTITAEVKVGHRSVMSYFLYPLLRGLDESIREP